MMHLLFKSRTLESFNIIQLANNICLPLANRVNNVKKDLGQLYQLRLLADKSFEIVM